MAIFATVLGLIALLFIVLTSVKHYASQRLITLEVMMAGCLWLLGLALCELPSAMFMGNSLLATQIVFVGACILFLLAAIIIVVRPVPRSEIRRWLGELASLLRGGMRLDSALFTTAANCRSLRLAEDSRQMADRVMGGDTLSQAMRVDEAFADIVPAVRRAEEDGDLPQGLAELASPGEREADFYPAHAVTDEPTPIRRVAFTIITEAIKRGMNRVELLPVQQGGNTGLSVLYANASGKRNEWTFVPHTARAPIINVMKLWAGCPYWAKDSKTATLRIRSEGRDYQMTVSIGQTELGESVSVAIAPSTES